MDEKKNVNEVNLREIKGRLLKQSEVKDSDLMSLLFVA
jgi:hypothetical protein